MIYNIYSTHIEYTILFIYRINTLHMLTDCMQDLLMAMNYEIETPNAIIIYLYICIYLFICVSCMRNYALV